VLPDDRQGHLEQGVDRRGLYTTGAHQCQLEFWRRRLQTATDDTLVRAHMTR